MPDAKLQASDPLLQLAAGGHHDDRNPAAFRHADDGSIVVHD
ncbi:hypothetical protein ACLBWT_07740 [Paenibacillus sp. D51F]